MSVGRWEAKRRGPVRDAIRILEREGVVETLPRRGAQVAVLTVKDVAELAGMAPITWPNDEQGTLSGIEIGAAFFGGCRKENPHIDAVMCVSDQVAAGVLCEARRRDVEVPGDLAVTGFGGFELAMPSGFDLTTIEVPGRKIGVASAKALLDPETARANKIIDVGYKLVERGTT